LNQVRSSAKKPRAGRWRLTFFFEDAPLLASISGDLFTTFERTQQQPNSKVKEKYYPSFQISNRF
jgi:hypothetical protein